MDIAQSRNTSIPNRYSPALPAQSGQVPPPSSRAAPALHGHTSWPKDRTRCMASKYFPDIPATSGDRASQTGIFAASSGVIAG